MATKPSENGTGNGTDNDKALALSSTEKKEYQKLDATVRKGLHTFIDVGCALREINDRKLYREEFSRFEDYLDERHEVTRARGYQLMDAATVVEELKGLDLSTIVDKTPLPANEAQARALVKLEPEDRAEVWREAVQAEQEGTKITAKLLEELAERRTSKSATPEPESKSKTDPEPKDELPVADEVAEEYQQHLEKARNLYPTLADIDDPFVVMLWEAGVSGPLSRELSKAAPEHVEKIAGMLEDQEIESNQVRSTLKELTQEGPPTKEQEETSSAPTAEGGPVEAPPAPEEPPLSEVQDAEFIVPAEEAITKLGATFLAALGTEDKPVDVDAFVEEQAARLGKLPDEVKVEVRERFTAAMRALEALAEKSEVLQAALAEAA